MTDRYNIIKNRNYKECTYSYIE